MPPTKWIKDRGDARCGRRQGAPRQIGPPRRSSLRHRRDRAARHEAELGPDERLRCAPHRRQAASRGRSSFPKEALARAVQIDIDPAMLSLRYPCEVNLHGRAPLKRFASCCLSCSVKDRDWLRFHRRLDEATGGRSESRACTRAHPVNPQRVVWEMSPRLPENAIVTSDSGSCANW